MSHEKRLDKLAVFITGKLNAQIVDLHNRTERMFNMLSAFAEEYEVRKAAESNEFKVAAKTGKRIAPYESVETTLSRLENQMHNWGDPIDEVQNNDQL